MQYLYSTKISGVWVKRKSKRIHHKILRKKQIIYLGTPLRKEKNFPRMHRIEFPSRMLK